MFGYVSVAELTAEIRSNLHRVPATVELVVGIPRSGMVPAYLMGLFMNRNVIDLDAFIANRAPAHGQTRGVRVELSQAMAARHILLVDDSVSTGGSMGRSLQLIRTAGYTGNVTTCAAIVAPTMERTVDIWFTRMSSPRVFEWNAFHHPAIDRCCFDLDGVLCVDPSEEDNDDGPRYRQFLANARPLFKPTGVIAHIVSARLEKYRELTETWLKTHGISYGKLHLIDLPTKQARQRLGNHGRHKAEVYKASRDSFLFFESEVGQAKEIARLSGKPVLCVANMTVYSPHALSSPAALLGHAKWRLRMPLVKFRNSVLRLRTGAPSRKFFRVARAAKE